MPHHHHGRTSTRSQEMQYRRIAWLRHAKRWVRKSMIVIIVILIIAVILSYIFITKEPEPQDIEVHKSLLERI